MIFYFFQKLLLKKFFFFRIQEFVLSVSGGIDSLSLIFLLKPICYFKNIKFIVIIINHRLKYSSQREVSKVSTYLTTYQIKNTIFFWFHQDIISNFQCFAHVERYKLIYSYCYFNKIKYLFLGHISNDRAENMFLKVIRRNSIYNIKFIFFIHHIFLFRPLIFFNKNNIFSFIKKNDFFWLEDKSNNNINFNRIKFRNLISNFNYKINLSKKLILVKRYFVDNKSVLFTNFFLRKYIFFDYLHYLIIKKYIFILNNIISQIIILKIVINSFVNKKSLDFFLKMKLLFFLNNVKKYSFFKLLIRNCYIFSDKNYIFFYRNLKFLTSILSIKNYINIFNNKYVLFSNIPSLKTLNLYNKLSVNKYNKKKTKISYFIIFSTTLDIYLVPLSNIVLNFSLIQLFNFYLYIENNFKKIYIKVLFYK